MDIERSADDLIDDIAEAAGELDSVFHVEGEAGFSSSKPITLASALDNGLEIKFPCSITEMDRFLSNMGGYVEQSSFGKGGKTSTDKAVRDALEVKAKYLQVRHLGLNAICEVRLT